MTLDNDFTYTDQKDPSFPDLIAAGINKVVAAGPATRYYYDHFIKFTCGNTVLYMHPLVSYHYFFTSHCMAIAHTQQVHT